MNGYHKCKIGDAIVEQFSKKTINICLRKPYDDKFIEKDYENKVKCILKEVIENNKTLENDFIICIDSSENIAKNVNKHNDTKIEIWLKFKKETSFKEKVKLAEQLLPNLIQL